MSEKNYSWVLQNSELKTFVADWGWGRTSDIGKAFIFPTRQDARCIESRLPKDKPIKVRVVSSVAREAI